MKYLKVFAPRTSYCFKCTKTRNIDRSVIVYKIIEQYTKRDLTAYINFISSGHSYFFMNGGNSLVLKYYMEFCKYCRLSIYNEDKCIPMCFYLKILAQSQYN